MSYFENSLNLETELLFLLFWNSVPSNRFRNAVPERSARKKALLNTMTGIQLSDVTYVINGCENKCTDSYRTEIIDQHRMQFKSH
jgi:hypothetical protein